MKEQLNPGIIESIPKSLTREVVHHIPHQPVIKESAESIKLWIVYDCSAQASKDALSLNDCLAVVLPPQPLLFDIFLRKKIWPFCNIGNIKKNIYTNQIKRRRQGCATTSLLWWYGKKKQRSVSVHQSDIWVRTESFYLLHLLPKSCRALWREVSWNNRNIIRKYCETAPTSWSNSKRDRQRLWVQVHLNCTSGTVTFGNWTQAWLLNKMMFN